MTRERMVYKTALSLATVAASGLVRLVFSLLVGHVFDPSMLGHANVIVSAAVFATLLCSPGVGQSVARQVATRGLDARGVAGRSLLVRATTAHHLLCLLVAIAVGFVVPVQFGAEHVLAAALTLAYGCYSYYKAVLYGVDEVRRYARLELSWDTLFLVALIVVAVFHLRYWVLGPMVLVYGGFSLGSHRVLFSRGLAGEAAASTRSAPSQAPPRAVGSTSSAETPDTAWWRLLGAFALVTTIGTASSAGFLQLSQVFAAHAGGAYDAGLFAAALSLVTPAYLLPRAVSVVLFPAMARAAGREEHHRVRSHLMVSTNVLAGALLPVFALVGALATWILTVVYPSGYAAGGSTFTIMVWATWVSIASVPAVNALSSDPGRAYFVPAGGSLAGFLIGLAMWFMVGRSIELVAWGYLVGSVIQSAVPMIEAARRHRTPSIGFIVRTVAMAAVSLAASLRFGTATFDAALSVAVVLTVLAAAAVLPELRALIRLALSKDDL